MSRIKNKNKPINVSDLKAGNQIYEAWWDIKSHALTDPLDIFQLGLLLGGRVVLESNNPEFRMKNNSDEKRMQRLKSFSNYLNRVSLENENDCE